MPTLFFFFLVHAQMDSYKLICNALPAPGPGPYKPCTGQTLTYDFDPCWPRGSPFASPVLGLNFRPAQTAVLLTWMDSVADVSCLQAPVSESVRFQHVNSFSEGASMPTPVVGLRPSRTACNPNVSLVLLQELHEEEFEAFVLVWSADAGYEFLSPGRRLKATGTAGVFEPGEVQRFCIAPACAGVSKGNSGFARTLRRTTSDVWVSIFDVKRRHGGCQSSRREREEMTAWFFTGVSSTWKCYGRQSGGTAEQAAAPHPVPAPATSTICVPVDATPRS